MKSCKYIIGISLALILNIISTDYVMAQFVPTNIPNCVLWLKSDSGLTIDAQNKVISWQDLSSNAALLNQTSASLRPDLINSNLYGFPAIKFDGVNDQLNFASTLSLNQITAFFILNPYYKYVNGIFGGPASPHFFCFANFNTDMRLNGNLSGNIISMSPNNILTDKYSILDLRTIGSVFQLNVNNQNISNTGTYAAAPTLIDKIGRRAIDGPFLGEMIEIIIFDRSLTNNEIDSVHQYLNFKYAKEIDLGADFTIPYKLCPDTTLSFSPSDFNEIIWNNTDTSFQFVVNEFGTITVVAKDKLNKISYDTLTISPDFTFNLGNDTTICLGSSLLLSTGLPFNYNFNWSTSATDSFIVVNSEDSYWLEVSDTLSCSFKDTIEIQIDSFSLLQTLTNDTSLCGGAFIQFNYNDSLQSILWSNNSNNREIVVSSSGEYYVEAVNLNACFNRDTVHINILGVAPSVDFYVDTSCVNKNTIFTDNSSATAPDNIDSWSWLINSDSISVQNPTYSFSNSGNYLVSLTVTTDSGCVSSIQKNVNVLDNPTASFTIPVVCANSDFEMNSNAMSVSIYDNINTYNWDIEGITYLGDSIQINNLNEGLYSVTHWVETNYGCVDSVSKTLEVFPEILADFEVENICLGDTTKLINTTQSYSIIDQLWSLGLPNEFTNEIEPNYFYPNAGVYNVSLKVTNALGCTRTVEKPIEIHNLPTASFTYDNSCEKQNTLFKDASNLTVGSSIEQSLWTIDETVYNLDSVNVFFNTAATVPVSYSITDNYGCSDDTSTTIQINSLPEIDFSFTPTYGTAPLAVQFLNQSNVVDYIWSFGDDSVSTEISPIHNYLENGLFNIVLVGISQNGCRNELLKQINIAPSEVDIELNNLSLVKTTLLDGSTSYKAQVLVKNVGSRAITNFDLYTGVNNETKTREHWDGLLDIGEAFLYTFTSSFVINSLNLIDYICITATNVNDGSESVLYNNKVCEVQDGTFKTAPLYPNPTNHLAYLEFISKYEGACNLKIVDMLGNTISYVTNINVGKGFNQYIIDCTTLQAGKYFIQLSFNDETITQSLIVVNK